MSSLVRSSVVPPTYILHIASILVGPLPKTEVLLTSLSGTLILEVGVARVVGAWYDLGKLLLCLNIRVGKGGGAKAGA